MNKKTENEPQNKKVEEEIHETIFQNLGEIVNDLDDIVEIADDFPIEEGRIIFDDPIFIEDINDISNDLNDVIDIIEEDLPIIQEDFPPKESRIISGGPHLNNQILFGDYEHILENVPFSNYSTDVGKQIHLLSIDENNSKIIGSASYKIGKPGDLDLYEDLIDCCSEDDVINIFIKGIKKIVKNYNKQGKNGRWFVEVKLGQDLRFVFDYNNLSNLFERVLSLYNDGIISHEDYDKLFPILDKIVNEKALDHCDYELLEKILREYRILRWNAKEINQGYKNLKIPNGTEKYYLEDAIPNSGKINFEGIAIVDDVVKDVSNFFVLAYYEDNEKNQLKAINLEQKQIDNFYDYFEENIKKGIYALYDSCFEQNHFKMLKRIWSLSRFIIIHNLPNTENAKNMIDTLIPIISSDLSVLNQMRAELDAIKDLYKINADYIPKKIIINQLDDIIFSLGRIPIISNNDLISINGLIHEIIDSVGSNNTENIIEDIEFLQKVFSKIIEDHTIEFIQANNLDPLPKWILPKIEFI